MREALFIKKNKDRWEKVQQLPADDPDEMASDFTRLVDDLAYAKTFYPTSKVTNYINTLASRIYLTIYKNRKEESNRLITFWKYDVPLTIRKHYRIVLFSLAFFVVFFLIGFFTAATDEAVIASAMPNGAEYIQMTKENIRNKNPFGVYESGNPFFSWLGIMINNIRYSLIMFAGGILFGFFTLTELAKTGVMVGAFDQLFAMNGLGLEFWLVVFVHGMFEITAIILAGAAGLIVGTSFLFPGTIKRMSALKQGAKDGTKLIIGLLPVFALAAFFEGFITRLYNDWPALTTAIFFLSTVFVIWYFIIYPIRLGKKIKPAALTEEDV